MIPAILMGTITLLGAYFALLIHPASLPGNALLKVMMGIVIVDTAIYLNFNLRGMAEILDKSKTTLERIKGSLITIRGRRERMWSRRIIKSCM